MDFPKRIKQHKAQSDSFAILLYKLKDLGIFRNVTENDYGIDFEIEIVHNEKFTAYLKAVLVSVFASCKQLFGKISYFKKQKQENFKISNNFISLLKINTFKRNNKFKLFFNDGY